MDTVDIATLYRVFMTTLQMLSDRKYIVKPELLDMSLEQFKAEGREYL